VHLAQLPVDAHLGKLLLLGAILGCLAPALSCAACLAHRSPFATGTAGEGAADAARRSLAAPGSKSLAAGQQSDHLLMAAALGGWLSARDAGGARGERTLSLSSFGRA
jgi:ATP-dependent RNA helicase DHX29